ncbi:MAG: hypothetical protein OWQ59_03545 [Alicyclobacillaceae bacterium]|jgi:hypothetical protein|uniref:hypothetical protein n=1 Tax=Alicyclobacillus sp. SP_1 TaxID=2942475 RepID=UPI00215796C7|nr:hypothetical protein [Alicyclobacillus sp. SP_1]MCY0887511.1 hypothetical protein [Alicyclobacillaceae bacterium]MCY0895128.1 hypothetical protein [Alicyclobacillaceae bacterium]
MYSFRKRRLPVRSWLIPLLLIALFVSAGIFDYQRQNVTVHVLSRSIDLADIRDIMLQPVSQADQAQGQYTTLNGREAILQLLNILDESKLVHSPASLEAPIFDTVYVSADSSGMMSIGLAVNTAEPKRPYLVFDGKTFLASPSLIPTIDQLIAKANA